MFATHNWRQQRYLTYWPHYRVVLACSFWELYSLRPYVTIECAMVRLNKAIGRCISEGGPHLIAGPSHNYRLINYGRYGMTRRIRDEICMLPGFVSDGYIYPACHHHDMDIYISMRALATCLGHAQYLPVIPVCRGRERKGAMDSLLWLVANNMRDWLAYNDFVLWLLEPIPVSPVIQFTAPCYSYAGSTSRLQNELCNPNQIINDDWSYLAVVVWSCLLIWLLAPHCQWHNSNQPHTCSANKSDHFTEQCSLVSFGARQKARSDSYSCQPLESIYTFGNKLSAKLNKRLGTQRGDRFEALRRI